MMHVEIEGISIQISHTHELFYTLLLTSLHHFQHVEDLFYIFFHLLPTLPVVLILSGTCAETILLQCVMHTKTTAVMWLNAHSKATSPGTTRYLQFTSPGAWMVSRGLDGSVFVIVCCEFMPLLLQLLYHFLILQTFELTHSVNVSYV